MENKAGLTGQTVPGRRIPGHWPYPGPEELAEAEPVDPRAWGLAKGELTKTWCKSGPRLVACVDDRRVAAYAGGDGSDPNGFGSFAPT